MMTPLELYKQQLQQYQFNADPQQEAAMQHLQRVYEELYVAPESQSLWKRWFSRQKKSVKGVYLWGTVGAGKTWLMDTFYKTLPTEKKLRMHFHRFMREVHRDLTRLQGHPDPLKQVARDFAEKTRIICFDEFVVNDVADAMILAGLLEALFAEGITLIITSNVAPDNLYRNGDQRKRFMPAIDLIHKNQEIIYLTSAADYRLRPLERVKTYYSPINAETEREMSEAFEQLAKTMTVLDEPLIIEGREIKTKRLTHQIVWFDFDVLCRVPRSQMDYLEIARDFDTVFLSGIPHIRAEQENLARYLINLIDVFYDAQVKLIVSAETAIAGIYPAGRLAVEFERTKSRLTEMQTAVYLSGEHRP